MIRVDATAHSTVIVCSKCPGWYWQLDGGDRHGGRRIAAAHETSVHPTDTAARRAEEKSAERLRNVVEPGG